MARQASVVSSLTPSPSGENTGSVRKRSASWTTTLLSTRLLPSSCSDHHVGRVEDEHERPRPGRRRRRPGEGERDEGAGVEGRHAQRADRDPRRGIALRHGQGRGGRARPPAEIANGGLDRDRLAGARVAGREDDVGGRQDEVGKTHRRERPERAVVALVGLLDVAAGVGHHEQAERAPDVDSRPRDRDGPGGAAGDAVDARLGDDRAPGVGVPHDEPQGERARGDDARVADQGGEDRRVALDGRVGIDRDVAAAHRQVRQARRPDPERERHRVVVLPALDEQVEGVDPHDERHGLARQGGRPRERDRLRPPALEAQRRPRQLGGPARPVERELDRDRRDVDRAAVADLGGHGHPRAHLDLGGGGDRGGHLDVQRPRVREADPQRVVALVGLGDLAVGIHHDAELPRAGRRHRAPDEHEASGPLPHLEGGDADRLTRPLVDHGDGRGRSAVRPAFSTTARTSIACGSSSSEAGTTLANATARSGPAGT